MNVILRHSLGAEPVELLRGQLTTPWDINLWDADAEPSANMPDLASADALVAMIFDQASAEAMPNLKLLQLPGAGFERIDFDAVAPQCSICNVFEHETGMAEYVLAAMLEWQIGIAKMDARLRQGLWDKGFLGGLPSHGELNGKTVGLVGYGHIGREVAARAKAFGMTVAAVTRTPGKADGQADRVAGMDCLGELCDVADFIVVACPLADETRGLIGPGEFRRMKESAVLINVARGPVVDEAGLFAACAEKQIAGAVIDVWYQYPDAMGEQLMPSRQPFHELDNVVMTPHASGWTHELVERRWIVIAENLDRLASGETLQNIVRASR